MSRPHTHNAYRVEGGVAHIVLERRNGSSVEALICTEDLDRVLEHPYRWCAQWAPSTKSFYVAAAVKIDRWKYKSIKLHRFLLNAPDGLEVDHINGDTLDNRRENLRLVTSRQNKQNRKSHRAGRLPGATYNRSSKKWIAQIAMGGRRYALGRYDSEQEAHAAYVKALAESGEQAVSDAIDGDSPAGPLLQ